MLNYEFLIAHYFKNPILVKYIGQVLNALSKGDSCVKVETADLAELEKLEEVNSKLESNKPFLIFNNHFSFQRYFYYEKLIADFIKVKNSSSALSLEAQKQQLLNHKAFLETLFADFQMDNRLSEIENIDWQKIAVITAFLNDFSIITGGPGTGKTTTVSKLLSLIFSVNPKAKIALTAQTGKAATRLKESLDNSRKKLKLSPEIDICFDTIEPKTLHRLLGYKPKSIDFKHNSQNPIAYDLVIVDESSMVDLPMMAKLMDSIGGNTKLILLGDKEQLPSVELGSVFGDLCDFIASDISFFSTNFHTFLMEFVEQKSFEKFQSNTSNLLINNSVQLQRSYRFSAIEGLGKFASKVLKNEPINLSDYSKDVDSSGVVYFSDWADSRVNPVFSVYENYIRESDPAKSIQAFGDLKVLAATHEGLRGVKELNLKIESWLEDKGLIQRKEVFYLNRPILITKNDYNLGLYNGDVGIVKLDEKGEKRVFFEDGLGGVKSINPSFLSSFETVFAMTIHKSQGSEFKNVFLVLPNSKESEILNRQLIYTAITRAKEKVFLLGDQAVLDAGISRKNERLSNLNYLLSL